MAVSQEQIDASDAVRLVLALEPARLDEQVIREVLGERAVKSLSEVAQAFGVAAATVRHTWRRDGMPGDAKAKRFILADILVWWLGRQKKNTKARGATEATRRKQEADAVSAEADARIKIRKAEQVEGEYVPLLSVRSVMKGILNVLRDQVMAVPRQLTPMFPAKYSLQWTEEVDRLLRHALTAAAETPIDDVLERINDDATETN